MRNALVGVTTVTGCLAWCLWLLQPQNDVADPCLSNLKQAGVAILMYTQDYDGRLPMDKKWMDEIQPYHKNEPAPVCPEVRRTGQAKAFGYAFYRPLGGRLESKIERAADEPLLFDSALLGRNESSQLESLPRPPGHHDHGHNMIVYLDGHAGGISPAGKRQPAEFFKGSSMH